MLINIDEKKIVIARILCMPASMRLSIGDVGSLDKNKLIEHIEKEDEIGELITKIYMHSLRTFKQEVEKHAK